MDNFEIDRALKTFTILVDSREQNTPRSRERYRDFGVPYERCKLDFGDYSAKVTDDNGEEITLQNRLSIERKMNLDELCNCFCRDRKRFEREFVRAKEIGAKIYLLTENSSWELAYSGGYRSQMKPVALVASMTAWLARYNCQLIMCKEETSGKLIKDLLYREMKEYLQQI